MTKNRTLAGILPDGNAMMVPVGNTAQRPANTAGMIRYNTTLGTLESANGSAWANVGSGSASSGSSYDANTISVGYFAIPQGNTAQRPANAPLGALRWNSSNTGVEFYVGNNSWQMVASTSYTVNYLLVAGGGGGGSLRGGGAGAGGMLLGTTTVNPGVSYSVTVGAGGAVTGPNVLSGNGGNSLISGLTSSAIGGGAGGADNGTTPSSNGQPGGSGGGCSTLGPPAMSAGSGTSGQGNSGGTATGTAPYYGSGGGGGAGASGSNGTATVGGPGGVGLSSSLSGTSIYYAGGGGGGTYASSSNGGAGGNGGGGNAGSYSGATTGAAGGTNTGGGGGGGSNGTASGDLWGGAGGSGIVIIQYLSGVQRATGGTVTQSGGYQIHKFTSSGTFVA